MPNLQNTPFVAIPHSVGLYVGKRAKFQKTHLDDVLVREDGRSFKIFREVIIAPSQKAPKRPAGIFRVWFYARGATAFTQNLAWATTIFFFGLPGFRHKLWLMDEGSGEFGGIYEWNTLADAEAYAESYAMRLSAMRAVPGKFSMEVFGPEDARVEMAKSVLLARSAS